MKDTVIQMRAPVDAPEARPPAEAGASGVAVSRDNNFNLLRLLLALSVLVSHAPELVDGNRQREVFTVLFHTLSLGEVAVDAFFLLSGYFIVQSWQREPRLLSFLKKRALRIYPAFIVASLLSVLVVGPLGSDAGAYFSQFHWAQFLKRMALLLRPQVPPVFQGQPYPDVNGAMWTIEYEFRCYLLAALCGMLGLLKKRQLWLGLSVVALFLSVAPSITSRISFPGAVRLLVNPADMARFVSFFCAGGSFYLFHDRIRYRTSWGVAAVCILVACMFHPKSATLGLATLGGYVLFWFGFAPLPLLKRFRTYPDISYGVYLYGWPIQKLLLWYWPSTSLWLLVPLTCILCCCCGLLSWHLVERPCLRLKGREAPRDRQGAERIACSSNHS